MVVCKDCGRIFCDEETTEELIPTIDDEYVIVDTCPHCGSADITQGNEDRF